MNYEIMRAFGFEKEVQLAKRGQCISCKAPVKTTDFRDELSRREHAITGMCQVCQDKLEEETKEE